MKHPMREEHAPVMFPMRPWLVACVLFALVAGSLAPNAVYAVGVPVTFAVILWGVLWLVTAERNRRRRGAHAYRQETDPIIDDSLGTWVHHSIRDRDNRRGGFWEGK